MTFERERRPQPRDANGPTITAVAPTARPPQASPPLVQRKCACGSGAPSGVDDRCETCRGKALQRFAATPATSFSPPLPPDEGAALERLGSGRPLDGVTRGRMEQGFGFDFSRVRIHDDADASTAARDLDARAFTYGTDVAFAAGELRPGTPHGDALLAHELAHVVQQSDGTATTGASASLEHDADRAAFDVVAGLHGAAPKRRPSLARGGGLALQRCGTSGPEANPADQRASTRLPSENAQCNQLATLGLMPSPPPAACVAPAPAGPAPADQPPVSAAARSAAETWDGDTSNPASAANRTALEAEFTGAIDDWLSANAATIAILTARDANRVPVSNFEGACRGAQIVVDRHFGPWVTNAARTPADLSRRATYRPTATGPVAGRNLFDSGDAAALAAHGVGGLTAQARALRIIAQYSTRARTAAAAHHFSPSRSGTEEQGWLAGVITAYLAAHPAAHAPLETFSRLAIHRQHESGIWLQTHSDGTDLGRLRTRWGNFAVCVHEYLHEVTHPRFMQAARSSTHAFEGFTEMFTKEVLQPMLPDSVPEDVKLLVEGAGARPPMTFDSDVIPGYATPPDYAESLRVAEQMRDSLRGPDRSTGRCSSQRDGGGNNAMKAAYFQGHVELLGLAPTGAGAGPVRAHRDEVAVPEGVTTIAALAVASGLTPAEITAANSGLTDGAFPPTVRLPGCREHIVMGYGTSAPVESVAETRGQIAAQNGVAESVLERANPGVTARGGWGSLAAGTSILIPRR